MAENNSPKETTIQIRHLNPQTKEKLENIADHVGIPLSQMLKARMNDLMNYYPPEYQLPKMKD